MESIYAALYQWVQAYGLPGVFLFMLVENLGVPFPTELGFLTAHSLVVSGAVPYWIAFLWIVSGHLLGAGVSFYLGRATGSALTRRLSEKPGVMRAREKLEGWYARYGALTVLFGRLEGHVRPWASFIAGLSQVRTSTFWLWTVIGSCIFTAVTMWVTAVGWQFWATHAAWRIPIVIGVLLIFYGLPVYKLVEHLVRSWRRRREKQAGQTAEE